MVGNLFACPFDGHLVCKLDNSEIPEVELGVLSCFGVGVSHRGWFNVLVKEKIVEPGDKVHEELYLWIRTYELAGCYGQLNLGGNASLEHIVRLLQSCENSE